VCWCVEELLRPESDSGFMRFAGDDGGKKREALLMGALIILIQIYLVVLTRFISTKISTRRVLDPNKRLQKMAKDAGGLEAERFVINMRRLVCII